MDTPRLRKARGAFFTPPEVAQYLVDWAVRSPEDRLLEPSCGEAGFLLSAVARLKELGANPLLWSPQLSGVEIHQESALAARDVLARDGIDADIAVANFFTCTPKPEFNAVVGNPPYIRYQQFSGAARAQSLEAALSQGVRLNGLASSWAAFVVHAAAFLKPEGRLAVVLPAELLTVGYAAEVRRFLLRRFSKVRLVMFEQRIFPGVLEEVVLLLAEGSRGASHFELYQAKNAESLASVGAHTWTEHAPGVDEKWTPALVSGEAFGLYRSVVEGEEFSPLLDWGETYLGAVTGNNAYFALSADDVARRGIALEDCVKICPPGSRHLAGTKFTGEAWRALLSQGERCFLFYPRVKAGEAAKRHVRRGARQGVHRAYKCTVRTPWWKVPLVQVPDLFLTYMNHDRPRLISNDARLHILNSLYGIKLRDGVRRLGRELLPVACLNSITLLGAEIVGRSYGGGLLKLEPREADRLPVPSAALLKSISKELRELQPQLSVALRKRDLPAAVALVDQLLLSQAVGISDSQLAVLRTAREVLFQRRRARGQNSGSN